jgi:hypothetical protein
MRHQILDCGCKIKIYDDGSHPDADIEFCNVHWAARDLLAASEKALNWLQSLQSHADSETQTVEVTINLGGLSDDIGELQAAIKKAGRR